MARGGGGGGGARPGPLTGVYAAFLVYMAGYSAYLYFTPNFFVSDVDADLRFSLPAPLGSPWALVYGFILASISVALVFTISLGAHHASRRRGRRRR